MYDNVRKPESDWYEAGYTAPRTDAAVSYTHLTLPTNSLV